MCVVARFGDTSPGSDDRISRAADSIAAVVERGHEIAVVASAMGSTTDGLPDKIKFEADDHNRAEIISMGERTSVRMLKTALAARGVNALFVEPGTSGWPIITSDLGETDVEATQERVAKLAAKFDSAVPVIIGFFAQNHDGGITTFGRGDSDTSVVMLGNYMDTDKVIIMTNMEGVITGGPRVVKGARSVSRITVDELRNLSFRGTEVVVPSALPYKDATLDVHVVHYQHGDLFTGGTLIEGGFHNLIDMQGEPLACLTVAGRVIRNRPGILADLLAALQEENIDIDSVASGMDSIVFYVLGDDSDRTRAVLHDRAVTDDALPSATVEDDTAAVRVAGGELPNHPGVILDIVEPLSEAGINIRGTITSATSVAIFAAWGSHEETLGIIRGEF